MYGPIFITLGILFLCTLFYTAYVTNGREVFSPPIVFFIFVFVYVFLRTIYMFYIVDFSFYEAPIDETVLSYGFIAMAIAVVSYCFGYLFVGGSHLKSFKLRLPFKGNFVVYGLIFLAMFGLFFYFRFMGVFSNQFNPFVSRYFITENNERSSLTFLAMGADVIFVVFLFQLAKAKSISKLKVFDYFLILVPIFTHLVTTNRGTIILYVVGALCVKYSLEKFKFPYFKFMIFVVVVVGALGLARGATQSEEAFRTNDFEYIAVFTRTAEHVLERPYHMAIDKTSFIVSEVAERDLYLYGQSLFSFVFAPVPRILWPEKPSVTIGPWVAKAIYNRENSSGVPPGIIAELFLNFSWPGIFLGMFLYGTVSRVIYNTHKKYAFTGPTWRVFYSIFLISLIFRLLGADFSGAVIFFMRLFLPFLLIVAFTRFRLD